MKPFDQKHESPFIMNPSRFGAAPWEMDIDFSETTTAGWNTIFVPLDSAKILAQGSDSNERLYMNVVEDSSNDNCSFDCQDATYGISSNLSNTSWLHWFDFYQDTNSAESNVGFFGFSAVTGQAWSTGSGDAMVIQRNANASTFGMSQTYNNGSTLHSGFTASIYASTAIDTQYYGKFQRDSATASSSGLYTNEDRSTGEVGTASQTPSSGVIDLRYFTVGNESASGGGNDIAWVDRIRVEDGTTTPP